MKNSNLSICFWLIVVLGFLGCASTEIKPVDLYPEDQCARCRMAISNEAFASEIITKSGDVLKFDDLGCQETFLSEQTELAVVAIYVKDFQTRAWLKKENSVIVQTSLKTPMGSGKVAVADSVQARLLVAKYPSTNLVESDRCSCCNVNREH